MYCKVHFGVDCALVTLVDDERQRFKLSAGIGVLETSRNISFCGHEILNDEVLLVRDTHLDDRFADNPLVVGEPFIRSMQAPHTRLRRMVLSRVVVCSIAHRAVGT
jgi:hypothetical protein